MHVVFLGKLKNYMYSLLMSEKINVRSKIDPVWGGAVPLAEALDHGLLLENWFLYRLSVPSVGIHTYIGVTSKKPEDQLAQHLASAREGSTHKLHKKLREFGLLHEFEVLSTHPNEVLALVAEMAAIKTQDADLNDTDGGNGWTYNLIRKNNGLGESVLYVIDKKKEALAKKQTAHQRGKLLAWIDLAHEINKEHGFR